MNRPLKDKLVIERSQLINWMITLILVIPFTFAISELAGINSLVKLVMDALWLGIALLPLLRGRLGVRAQLLPLAILVCLFLADVLIVYLFRYQSFLYFLWGLRNNFRFYVLFFAIAAFFSEKDGIKCLNLFDRLFWLNALISFIQFGMGFKQDFLGGIFGTARGCNGYMSVYFCIVISKSVLSYMNGSEKTLSCFAKCLIALILSAMAELKFFFFAFALILLLSMLLTSFSFKKVVLFLLCTVLILVTTDYLGSLYKSFDGFFSLETLLNAISQSNYASANDMGRFSALRIISRRFLKDVPAKLFGLGLGNCDESSFSFFNTPFFNIYNHTHYYMFSHSFMFIENGYVGLIFYIAFFVICFISAAKNLRNKRGFPLFCQMSVILSILCLILLIYNSALRTEAGFMIYFVLALTFIEPDTGKTKLIQEVNT